MTVSELIIELQKMPPHLTVVRQADEWPYHVFTAATHADDIRIIKVRRERHEENTFVKVSNDGLVGGYTIDPEPDDIEVVTISG